MDDLISRKALYDAMEKREEMYAKGNCLYDAYNYHVSAEIVSNAPSVPAVPLEPLCEWLSKYLGKIRCKDCWVSCSYSLCPGTADDWRRVITNWMEGLDDNE